MSKKPLVISSSKYNINDLPSDRRFEELMHRIFQYRIEDKLIGRFDDAQLMSGVAEKGIDILLKKDEVNAGAIQCKFNTSGNINKPDAAKEIIKFVLYYYNDNSLIDDLSTFQYYFVCSGKFASTTINLLGNFKNSILLEKDLQKWTEAVLKKYTAFDKLSYSTIETELKEILKNVTVRPKSYSEINNWLNIYKEIADEFFEIKKVVDNKAIEQGIKDVIEVISPDLEKKAKTFITSYYKSAKIHLDSVKFIGHDTSFNRPRNITVTKLYVDPFFKVNTEIKTAGKNIEEFQKRKKRNLRIHDVFKRSRHYIILGDPGAGKSLMVKSLILRFIKGRAKIGGLKTYQNHIPFRIELRKYSEKKIKDNISIISYLASLLDSEYQLSNIDKTTIEYIVQNQSTLFFFDGLDEIFDIAQKNNIRDDIVNFISNNKKVKCIITSRFIGYHDITFPTDKFYEFSIQDFNDKQIDKFIEKFYNTQIQNKSEKKKEIENCKKQLKEVDKKLKSNPLILSLMSLLAINKLVIPDSKLEVYRSCTNTLVETRDKNEKELTFNLKVKNSRGTLGNLAYWQYCQVTDKKKVSRILAHKVISDYLIEQREYEDVFEADEAAEHFLKYAECRSIYFDNTFTHKTFLEYYAAEYICKRFHNGFKHKKRDEIIAKYISNSSWHIVFELLIAMIDEQVVETDLLDKLFKTHMHLDNVKTSYFFLNLLPNTTNISNTLKKSILLNSINIILNEKDMTLSSAFDFQVISETLASIVKLGNNSALAILFQEIIYQIEGTLNNERDKINFYNFFFEFNQLLNRFNRTGSHKYLISHIDEIELLRKKDIVLLNHSILSTRENDLHLKAGTLEQIKNFGVNSIFDQVGFKFIDNSFWSPMFNIYFRALTFTSANDLQKDLKDFRKCRLTLDVIKNKFKLDKWTFDDDRLQKSIELYLLNDILDVDRFLQIILSKINIIRLENVGEEFEKKPKYAKFINSLK